MVKKEKAAAVQNAVAGEAKIRRDVIRFKCPVRGWVEQEVDVKVYPKVQTPEDIEHDLRIASIKAGLDQDDWQTFLEQENIVP